MQAGASPISLPNAACSLMLGILMLQTRFPRLPGDVGHPGSFRMPVRYLTVEGASPERVVRQADTALLQPFVRAARSLVAQGARALTTSCGFLVQFQAELQAAVSVPVWTSALLKLPELSNAGVITVDATSFGQTHLRLAGARTSTPVQGLAPGCALQRTLLEDRLHLDVEAAQADTVSAAQQLVSRHPELTDLVLECTNLPPYAAAIERATGRRVHHLVSLVHERWVAHIAPLDGDVPTPIGYH